MRRWTALLMVVGMVLAFPLRAAEPATNRSLLLIANEGMADPRFRESVVLVTRHGRSQSTIGVIVNRAFDVRLDQVFPDFRQATQHRLHYGGPVSQGQIVYMVRGAVAPNAALTLADQLYLSSDAGSLRRLIEATIPSSRLRVFDGYSSWAPGQLENEIDRGDWYLLPVDADALFSEPLGELWQKLLRQATQRMVRLRLPALRPYAASGI